MKYNFFKSSFVLFVPILSLYFASCDNSKMKNTNVSADKADSSLSLKNTVMPPEPASAKVASTDSIAPSARHANKDSIGAKIIIHRSRIKVVDTAKH